MRAALAVGIDVSKTTLDMKIEAMKQYRSKIKERSHAKYECGLRALPFSR